ncbi:MAG TPA: hypothetical protein DCX06_03200 [Opitutae bacterium]|nr:hypothetical protein [Opitutae bacterium]
MQFKDSKVVLFHGVVDLRKGAAGLVGLIDNPEPQTWYLFSNRSRTLLKCVRLDRSGVWMGTRRLKQGHYHWVERSRGSSCLDAHAAEDLCSGKQPKIYD